MSCRIIAYTYMADVHCVGCTAEWAESDGNGHLTGIDGEGNEIHPIFPWDEWIDPDVEGTQTLICGTCHGEIERYEP
jgi:hypothetical protein